MLKLSRTRTHASTSTHMHVHIHTHKHTHAHASTHTHVRKHARMQAWAHNCIHAHAPAQAWLVFAQPHGRMPKEHTVGARLPPGRGAGSWGSAVSSAGLGSLCPLPRKDDQQCQARPHDSMCRQWCACVCACGGVHADPPVPAQAGGHQGREQGGPAEGAHQGRAPAA